MKATIVITGLGTGGAERFLNKLLPLEGVDVDVVSVTGLDEVGRELEEKVPVKYLNEGKSFKPLKSFFSLRKHLKKRKPDVVLTFLIHADIFGRITAKMAGVKKVICCVRNDYSTITKLWLADKYTKFLVDEYVVNSDSLKSYMDKLKVRNYKVIPNGVDVEELELKAEKGFKEEINVKDRLITCIARLKEQKDQKTLVEAMQYLKGCTLALVGEGEDREKLERLVKELGVEDKVLFPGNRTDIPRILADTDVFVLPSKVEGMSNSLLEAMALGKRCVVSDIPQNKTLIKHEENGLTFKTNNAKDLAKKITQTKKEHGEKARKTIKEKYEIGKIRKRYKELIESGTENLPKKRRKSIKNKTH